MSIIIEDLDDVSRIDAIEVLAQQAAPSSAVSNINNTSDADKPVSIAQQSALDLKAPSSAVSNINNTSDADKPVSIAQQSAIDEMVKSVVSADPGAIKILNMVRISQADYDALTPVVSTLYIIVG